MTFPATTSDPCWETSFRYIWLTPHKFIALVYHTMTLMYPCKAEELLKTLQGQAAPAFPYCVCA